MADEEVLAGGNASAYVVRVGSTVRKPWLTTTPTVVAYMDHVRAAGVEVPHTHGRDEQGRLVLDHVPGRMAIDLAPLPVVLVRAAGALVRRIHDASEGFPLPDPWPTLLPADAPDLMCHGDLATWNLVVDGDRLVFIDWDGAAPSTRLWDLAYSATAFGHLFPGADVDASAARLAAFVDGYDADEPLRTALPEAMVRRADAMHQLLRRSHADGREPWGSMYVEGHGEHWASTTAFVAEHADAWRRALA